MLAENPPLRQHPLESLCLRQVEARLGFAAAILVQKGGTKVMRVASPWKHPDTGIYYFRRGVPEALRSLVGKREEKVSSETTLSQARSIDILRRHSGSWQRRPALDSVTICRRELTVKPSNNLARGKTI